MVQRVLIESLVLSVTGTLVGLALAWSLVRVLATGLPDSLTRVADVGIDARVLGVAAVAALVTGLVSGLAPALQGLLVLYKYLNRLSIFVKELTGENLRGLRPLAFRREVDTDDFGLSKARHWGDALERRPYNLP